MAPGPHHLAGGSPLGREVERESRPLMDEPEGLDPAERPAAPLDGEVRQRNDVLEPPPEKGDRDELVVDQQQDAIVSHPVRGLAPEGETAGVVDVVAKDRAVQVKGVRSWALWYHILREQEGPGVVQHAQRLEPVGDLIPAVEVAGRVGASVKQSPPLDAPRRRQPV